MRRMINGIMEKYETFFWNCERNLKICKNARDRGLVVYDSCSQRDVIVALAELANQGVLLVVVVVVDFVVSSGVLVASSQGGVDHISGDDH